MRVLVYKRTHNGDPDADGCFGVYDCMGSVRDRDFDAVVGVGGIGQMAVSNDIDGKVNWVGIGPHKRYVEDKRGPEVLFDHFLYFGNDGPDFRAMAPQLAARMYGDNARSILNGVSDAEQAEVESIVRLAEVAPPSPGLRASSGSAASQPARCYRGRAQHNHEFGWPMQIGGEYIMHEEFLAFAEQQGCRLVPTGEGHTIRIYFGNQNLGYVNPTVQRREACYGYRFWRDHENDAAPKGSEALFKQRYGDLPGLDWHQGTGKNSHRRFLCINDRKSAEAVLLSDIKWLRNSA